MYLQCKLGGIYDENEDNQDQHLNGTIKNFNFYLNSHTEAFELDENYSWIKCNKDFKSYYITDYSEENIKAIEYVLTNDTDKKVV